MSISGELKMIVDDLVRDAHQAALDSAEAGRRGNASGRAWYEGCASGMVRAHGWLVDYQYRIEFWRMMDAAEIVDSWVAYGFPWMATDSSLVDF